MNIWLPGRSALEGLQDANLFPILESGTAEAAVRPPAAAALDGVQNTLAKLRRGEPVSLVAWGDSVTDGSYLPSPDDRWQIQFVTELRRRFPSSEITLVSEGWGGRSTRSYMEEPQGSERHFPTCVLRTKPDLVISEFVNDMGYLTAEVEERYSAIHSAFRAAGAEWAILTPHYTLPAWMPDGVDCENGQAIEEDPRECVRAIKAFAARRHSQGVTIADASRLWGRFWRRGIPYTSLLMNSINHPNRMGLRTFVDALLPLFPAE
jgi:hypothetical protein